MAIKHPFTSAKIDGVDVTLVQPSNWNANHTIDNSTITKAMIENVAAARVLGSILGGAPAELTASQIFDLVSVANGVILTRTAGVWAAAANVAIDSGDMVHTVGTLTAPAAGKIKQGGVDLAGRSMNAVMNPAGLQFALQPLLAQNRIGIWLPPGSNSQPLAVGINAPTQTGTVTSRTPTSTNLFTSTKRVAYVSTATVGSIAGTRNTVAQIWRGNAAGLGGFFATFRFGVDDAVAATNMFVGLSDAIAAPTNAVPSSLVNIIGIGCNSGDTNMQFYSAGSAAQPRVDLGANFPANTNALDLYELMLYAPPNGGTVTYRVTRLNTGHVATGVVAASAGAVLPSSTTFVTQQIWRSNDATATAVSICLVSHYIESEA